MTDRTIPEWWRTAVRDAQAEYETAMTHVDKALDALYAAKTLVHGIGYGRRADKQIEDTHALWVRLAAFRDDIGEATPDD